MMKVFNQEKLDGLENVLTKENSVSYASAITVTEKPIVMPEFVHSKAASSSWDLFDFYSILASVGWNSNDDVFTKEETWNARNTPVHKKVNLQHNETDIIGVITASVLLDNNRNIIPEDNPPEQFDVAVAAALYKVWEDPELQKRMDNLITEIKAGYWSVSMECWFPSFDYAAIRKSDGHQFVIPRTEATSFLTKHLRFYGGSGEYQGHRLGRLLRNLVFSGKGVVKNPANDRSVIFNFKSKAELIMDNVDELKSNLTKAEAKIEKLQEELMSKVEAAQKVEKEKLEKSIEKLNLTIADKDKDIENLKSEAAKSENSFAALEKEVKSLKDELAKANSELSKAKSEKKLAERRSQLATAGIEKVDEILQVWSEASDEQFSQVVELSKASVKPAETVPNLEKAEVKAPAVPNIDPNKENLEQAKAAQDYFKTLFKEKV